jgi:hypothetical protein
LGVSLLVAGALWAQGLVVCGKCGREARPGDTVCRHCQEALPKPKADTPSPAVGQPAAPADDKSEVGRLAAGIVEANVRQARELEAKQPELALCYYQNAMALMRLVPAGTFPDTVSDAILAGNTRTLNLVQRGTVPCKRCNGSGRYQIDFSKVDSSSGHKTVPGVPCPTCKGVGTLPGLKEVSKAKMQLLQGRAEFEQRQMVAGDVKVGRVLVPPALDKLLSNRQRALVMTGMPMPCSECRQTARQACTACRGSGWKPCDFEGCSQGVLKETRRSGARKEKRMNEEAVKKCPRCDGLGDIPCPTCKGSRSVACSKCDGSGLAPRCTRCTGTGLMQCRRCKGTGDVKGTPCPECKGETQVLCSACQGEGAQSR